MYRTGPLRDIDASARLSPRVPTNHNILRFSGVTVRYGDLTALRNVTLEVPCGSSTAVLGANGAGKSTLLRSIVGLRRLAGGEILIGDSHPQHARPRIAYVPQRHSVDWDFPITVRGVVEQGRYPSLGLLRRFGRADVDRVDRAMEELGILDLAGRQIRRLSGGQQQRVFLARAVAQGGDIFLLDEPFAGLDIFAVEELARELGEWEAQGRTVLAAMHDLEIARRSFRRGILLATDLIADGPIADVLEARNIQRAYHAGGGPSPGPAPLLAAEDLRK
jgi:ABC-type Mn2+/Zn2+ transport system ATPase subunit